MLSLLNKVSLSSQIWGQDEIRNQQNYINKSTSPQGVVCGESWWTWQDSIQKAIQGQPQVERFWAGFCSRFLLIDLSISLLPLSCAIWPENVIVNCTVRGFGKVFACFVGSQLGIFRAKVYNVALMVSYKSITNVIHCSGKVLQRHTWSACHWKMVCTVLRLNCIEVSTLSTSFSIKFE